MDNAARPPSGAVDNAARLTSRPASVPLRGAEPGAGSLEAARVAGSPEDARAEPEAARVGWAMLVVGVLAVLAAAAGIAVPATHGTWTTADEPQYLLTAISLAEDGDLDIADELAEGRWRPFHRAAAAGADRGAGRRAAAQPP